MNRHACRLALSCLVAGACCTARAEGPVAAPIAGQLSEGAMLAQSRCYALIHHDTWEFGDCVRTLAVTGKGSDAKRLGVEYFGWVGAMNSARLGMLGADETAREFITRFRKTQRKLKIDDQTLCASVPGDCVARIARLTQMEDALPANAVPNRR
jgi:hypothetical protein